MKRLFYLAVISLVFTSCEENLLLEEHNYEFKMVGRTYQDINGFYHLNLDPNPQQQTLHRFGAYVTNIDKWNLPTKIIW